MKKSIPLITLILISAAFLILSFTPNNKNKEYVSIFYLGKYLFISNSNGVYKNIKADKIQGRNDQI